MSVVLLIVGVEGVKAGLTLCVFGEEVVLYNRYFSSLYLMSRGCLAFGGSPAIVDLGGLEVCRMFPL